MVFYLCGFFSFVFLLSFLFHCSRGQLLKRILGLVGLNRDIDLPIPCFRSCWVFCSSAAGVSSSREYWVWWDYRDIDSLPCFRSCWVFCSSAAGVSFSREYWVWWDYRDIDSLPCFRSCWVFCSSAAGVSFSREYWVWWDYRDIDSYTLFQILLSILFQCSRGQLLKRILGLVGLQTEQTSIKGIIGQ